MRKLLAVFLILFTCSPLLAKYRYYGSEYTRIFYYQNQVPGWKAKIVGRVLSLSTRKRIPRNNLMNQVRSKQRASVRLYTFQGIRKGDTLFVINSTNKIVSRLKVQRIFTSASLGYMLIGVGNFKLSAPGDRVVRRIRGKNVFDSRVHVRRGHYFMRTGRTGRAIAQYKRAIELDKDNAEAHLSMGKIYLKQKMLRFAAHEFSQAYNNLSLLYDNQDKYDLLKNFTRIRFIEVNYKRLPKKKRSLLRAEGITYAKKAIKLNPYSVDCHYYLALFYYNNPQPKEVLARDHLLKIIELDPSHTNAYVYLGKMYYSHNNIKKARYYVYKALGTDPKNKRARHLLRKIKRGRD